MAKRKRKPQAQLDIIIPVYGQAIYLEKCLTSIQTEISYRLIIVDDCSPEDMQPIYRNLNGNSQVIYHQTNRGFSRSVNDGVAKGNAPLILILNSDVELTPGCIEAMIAEFDNQNIGVVGPKLLFPEDSQDLTRPAGKIQHAGLAIDFAGRIIHANIGWDANNPKVNNWRELQAVTGACLMTRRTVWNQILDAYHQAGDPTSGAFNEVYGKGTYEDIEYCFATRSVGKKVIYTPQAVAYHHVGTSVRDSGYPLQRNEMIFKARCGQLLAWDEWRFL